MVPHDMYEDDLNVRLNISNEGESFKNHILGGHRAKLLNRGRSWSATNG